MTVLASAKRSRDFTVSSQHESMVDVSETSRPTASEVHVEGVFVVAGRDHDGDGKDGTCACKSSCCMYHAFEHCNVMLEVTVLACKQTPRTFDCHISMNARTTPSTSRASAALEIAPGRHTGSEQYCISSRDVFFVCCGSRAGHTRPRPCCVHPLSGQ
jgi:hypothetical protein